MTNPKDPAFPTGGIYSGLSKREYFAGLALQGFISRGALAYDTSDIISVQSVVFADALIEALNK